MAAQPGARRTGRGAGPTGGGGRACFLPVTDEPSIYRPASGQGHSGRGSVRVREIKEESEGLYVVGTLATDSLPEEAAGSLVWMQLPLESVANLYGYLEADQALAAGEWRFRSLKITVRDAAFGVLRELEGVSCDDVRLRTVPRLSSPADLHALAVLGVRLFCVNEDNTHAAALDECLSLARTVADSEGPVEEAVGEAFAADGRWAESLGPQRLWWSGAAAEDAVLDLPAALWQRALANLVRMFPGLGSHCDARHLGDARNDHLHLVFDRALARTRSLAATARAILLADLARNREVHRLISATLERT